MVVYAGEQIFRQANANVNKNVFGDIIYNVKAFGSKGNGTNDDTASIQKTINAMGNGGILYFPNGNYVITSDLDFGDKDIVIGYDPIVSFAQGIKYLTKPGFQFSTYGLTTGGLGNGNGGVLLGGVGRFGGDGILLGMDGNPSWMTMMPSKKGSNTEVTIQPTYDLGYVNTSGTTVTWLSGNKFDSEWLGANIYIDDTLFHVQSYDSDTQITLVEDAGTRSDVPYQKISTTAKGTVTTAGTTVTWVQGNLFAYFWDGQNIIINSVTYTIDNVVSENELELTTSAGNQTNVGYSFDQTNSFDAAAIGINKKSGESEERFVISAKAYGEYRYGTVATGRGKHFPVFLDVGGENAMKVNIDQSIEFHNGSGNTQVGLFPHTGRTYYLIAKTNGQLSLFCDSVSDVFIVDGDTARMSFVNPPVLPSYSKSSLPPQVAAGMIYVTDDTGGAVPAFSDGTNWRRVTDRSIIS